MNLHQISPLPAAIKKRKRVGRGPGSGHGKTSCRGHKGNKARTGGSIAPGFEGGQMPLIRRLPKRGFTNVFREPFTVVNLRDLDRFEPGSVIDPAALQKAGILRGGEKRIKILGMGELTKPLTVKAHAFSAAAKSRIETVGGKTETI